MFGCCLKRGSGMMPRGAKRLQTSKQTDGNTKRERDDRESGVHLDGDAETERHEILLDRCQLFGKRKKGEEDELG
uniref:Cytoplasmic envelopment protein 3 n=1 Tax=Caenorhabditis tropicalis TaxID=1561998 RepID=A0A1I7UWG3_9PELO